MCFFNYKAPPGKHNKVRPQYKIAHLCIILLYNILLPIHYILYAPTENITITSRGSIKRKNNSNNYSSPIYYKYISDNIS